MHDAVLLYSFSGIFFRCQNCKYNSCQQNYIASQFPNFENCISSATGGLLQSHWTGHLFVPRQYCEQPDCLQWQAEQLQLGWDQNSTEYAIHPQVVSHYKRSLSLTCHSERIYNTSLLYLHLSGVIRVILWRCTLQQRMILEPVAWHCGTQLYLLYSFINILADLAVAERVRFP